MVNAFSTHRLKLGEGRLPLSCDEGLSWALLGLMFTESERQLS